MATTNMDKETFETLARLLRIMTYIFEAGDQPEDKEILHDIARVRAWMAKIEMEVDQVRPESEPKSKS